jgi:3',5'-cyclic AMP phosphodiesterase CpdA
VAAASLLAATGASAQTLTYGPIIARGNTPDQSIIHWGTSGTADATTVAYRKQGEMSWQMAQGDAARDHEVILQGLTAGTTYEYQVSSLTGTPEGATFTTCPLPGRAMDFVFYGDSRSGMAEHVKIVGQVATKAPEMVFESGDIVPDGAYAHYLSEFFPAVKDLARSTPFMAAPGNHDASSDLATNYGLVFPAPRPSGAPWQAYYSFPCGNALFIGLDSNSVTDAAQLSFLTSRLQAAQNDATIDHVFVWLHHAPYSVGLHGDNTTVQSQWVPIFNQPANKVTAVFSGHDHLYARMDDGSGVRYIVSGGAGAGLYPDVSTSKAKKVAAKSSFNFVAVHLAGPSMSAVVYDDTGTELDRFSFTKGAPPPDGGELPDLGTSGGSGSDLAMAPSPGGGCAVAATRGNNGSGALAVGAVFLFGIALSRRRWRRAV